MGKMPSNENDSPPIDVGEETVVLQRASTTSPRPPPSPQEDACDGAGGSHCAEVKVSKPTPFKRYKSHFCDIFHQPPTSPDYSPPPPDSGIEEDGEECDELEIVEEEHHTAGLNPRPVTSLARGYRHKNQPTDVEDDDNDKEDYENEYDRPDDDGVARKSYLKKTSRSNNKRKFATAFCGGSAGRRRRNFVPSDDDMEEGEEEEEEETYDDFAQQSGNPREDAIIWNPDPTTREAKIKRPSPVATTSSQRKEATKRDMLYSGSIHNEMVADSAEKKRKKAGKKLSKREAEDAHAKQQLQTLVGNFFEYAASPACGRKKSPQVSLNVNSHQVSNGK